MQERSDAANNSIGATRHCVGCNCATSPHPLMTGRLERIWLRLLDFEQ
jgi:hypothetical protein